LPVNGAFHRFQIALLSGRPKIIRKGMDSALTKAHRRRRQRKPTGSRFEATDAGAVRP
jgi:hypothetical protein